MSDEYLVHEEKCGCKFERGYRPFQDMIVFCKLHAAAPDLLAALGNLKKGFLKNPPETEYDGRAENGCCMTDSHRPTKGICPWVEANAIVDAAIAKATGGA